MVVSPLVTKGYGTPTMIVTFGYGAVPPIPSSGGGGGGGGDMFYPDYCDYHKDDPRCKKTRQEQDTSLKDVVEVCIVEQDMDKCKEILVPKIELQELDFNLQEEIIQDLRMKLEKMQIQLNEMEMNKVVTIIQKSEDPKVVFDIEELRKLIEPMEDHKQEESGMTMFDILTLPLVMFFNELNRIMRTINEVNIEILKNLEQFIASLPPLPIVILPGMPLPQLPEPLVVDASPARIDPIKRPDVPFFELPPPPEIPQFEVPPGCIPIL